MALRLPPATTSASASANPRPTPPPSQTKPLFLLHCGTTTAMRKWSLLNLWPVSRRRQGSPRIPALLTLLPRSGFEGLFCAFSCSSQTDFLPSSLLLTRTSPLRFRPRAPSSFHAVYERATTQRFFLLSRTRRGTDDCPEELFELTGSTGNVYSVHIQKQPTCSCPHATAGNQCKHIVWCLKSILRAPDAHVYQLALLSTELRDIFAKAPAPADESGAGSEKDRNRKEVEGDCPICFEEMRAGDAEEPLVWCKAACGQNIVRLPPPSHAHPCCNEPKFSSVADGYNHSTGNVSRCGRLRRNRVAAPVGLWSHVRTVDPLGRPTTT